MRTYPQDSPRSVVQAWVSAIDADEHRADAETEVLQAAERCWGIGRSLR